MYQSLEDLINCKNIRFLGAEGVGMQALIGILKDLRSQDRYVSTNLVISCSDLAYAGNDDPITDEIDFAVRSTAIKTYDPHYQLLDKFGKNIIHRSDMLNLLSSNAKQIVITGTHGKTSTSAIATHIFKCANLSPGFAIGGKLQGYATNGKAAPDDGYFILEGDESDKSYLKTSPYMALLTDVEPDHLENYPGGFEEIKSCFFGFMQRTAMKVICLDNPILATYFDDLSIEIQQRTITYSSLPERASDLYINLESQILSIRTSIKSKVLESGKDFQDVYAKNLHKYLSNTFELYCAIPGSYNLLNASGAIALGFFAGIKLEVMLEAIGSIKGVARRFELVNSDYQDQGINIYDDYAHHPTEVKLLLESVVNLLKKEEIQSDKVDKSNYKDNNKKALFIYQPHHPERTQQLWCDFKKVFSDFLLSSKAMYVDIYIADIYVARSKHIDGVTAELLVKEINDLIQMNLVLSNRSHNSNTDVARSLVSYLEPVSNETESIQGNFKDITLSLLPRVNEILKRVKYSHLFLVGAGNIVKVVDAVRA